MDTRNIVDQNLSPPPQKKNPPLITRQKVIDLGPVTVL